MLRSIGHSGADSRTMVPSVYTRSHWAHTSSYDFRRVSILVGRQSPVRGLPKPTRRLQARRSPDSLLDQHTGSGGSYYGRDILSDPSGGVGRDSQPAKQLKAENKAWEDDAR